LKYIVIICDGMADQSYMELNDKTPLEYAYMPFVGELSHKSIIGKVKTIPLGHIAGSLNGNLTVLGYDLNECKVSLGAIYANNMRLLHSNLDYFAVARFNSMNVASGKEMFTQVCESVFRQFNILTNIINDRDILLHIKNVNIDKSSIENLLLRIEREIDIKLRQNNISEANVKIFGGGNQLTLTKIQDKYKCKSVMVGGSALLECIAKSINLDFIRPDGATGKEDTNLDAKSNAAIEVIGDYADIVFLHIDGSDFLSHQHDIYKKVKFLEKIDSHIVKRIVEYFESQNTEFKMLFLPDHYTFCSTGQHGNDMVPFLFYDSVNNENVDITKYYSENYPAKDIICEGHTLLKKYFSI